MASIDERVVAMSFENAKFEAGVATTMRTLDKLNLALRNVGSEISFAKIETESHKVTFQGPLSALDKLKTKFASTTAGSTFSEMERAADRVSFQGPINALDRLKAKLATTTSGTTFTDMERSADRISFSGLISAIEGVASKFGVLKLAAGVALGGIATQLATKFAGLAKSLTLDPAIGGLQEYATNLNSIQTILANTAAQGTNLKDVNGALQELNTYSDQTIYNFSQMANSIGLFTAAGVNLDTSVNAIKGIANLAALSGSNADQATHAMQQLSQAVAAGKVTMQDWISVRNAGLGGQVFQKALFDTAKALGTLKNVPMGQTFEEWKKAGNSFTKSLSETQDKTESASKVMGKARKDAAKTVSDAEKASADAIEAATNRVKDAQESAAEDMVSAAKKVKDAQESAAEATTNAAQKVKDAQKTAADAAKQSANDIRDAQIAQRESVKQSAEEVRSALDEVTAARKRLAEALKPPSADELEAASDRLKTAQLDQVDLADAVTQAQQEQKRASEDLAAAQDRLTKTKSTGTADEIQAAQRAFEDIQKRAKDSADAVERAQIRQRDATRGVNQATQELQDTQKKGAATDQKVVDARDALTQSLDNYRDAQKKADAENKAASQAVADARKKGAEQQQEAGRKLAEAERDQAKTIIDARASVADAEADQAKSILKANEAVTAAEKDKVKATEDAQARIADAHEQAAQQIEAARKSTQKEATTWLTSEVLTKTLSQFTGDMTDAQLAAMGFNAEQVKAIQQMAKTAKESATQVKTMGQVFSVAKETIGSGWAKTFELIFGNFKEAKGTFTDLSNTINGFINTNATARNKVLKEWKALGGRTELIKGIETAFKNVMAVLKPIGDAFHDIFPKKSADDLLEMTKRFTAFAESLKPSPVLIDALRRIFGGLFAVFDIAKTVIGEVIGVVTDLFGIAGEGSGGFVQFLASIGDFLVAIDKAITKGGVLKGIFKTLGAILRVPVELLKELASALVSIFTGSDPKKAEGVAKSIGALNKVLLPLRGVLDDVKAGWERFLDVLDRIRDRVEPGFTRILEFLGKFGDYVADAFNNINWDRALAALQTGLIGGIFLKIKKAFAGGLKVDLGGGIFKNLNEGLGILTGHLKAMQRNVQANTLLQIGLAVAVLAAGVFLLSQIPSDKLSQAMTATAIGLAQLVGAMVLLSKAMAGGGLLAFAQMPLIAGSMILLATATTILAAAMKIMATMSWEDLAKGLVGVGGALAAVAGATQLINGPKLIVAGLALIPLAIGMNLLAVAVKMFSEMSWEDLAKGLAGAALALAGIALGLTLMPPSVLLIGPGLAAVAFAMTLLAGAVSAFGGMDLKKMIQGILGVAGAIVAIGYSISLIPPTVALQAAGLLILAAALSGIAAAVAIFGHMDIETLVKGLISLSLTLDILALGLTAMSGTLPGSAALLAAAAAFAILGPAIAFMGQLKIGTLVKGLVAMALILTVLAIAGTLAAGPLTALGLALAVLGGGMLAISAALSLFILALAELGDHGPKAITATIAAFAAFLLVLPKMILDFIKGLVVILAEIVKLAPAIADSLVKIATTLLDAIISLSPKIAEAIGALVVLISKVLGDNVPVLITAGFKLLIALMTGIRDNIGQIITLATDIIVAFVTGLGDNAPRIVAAGVTTLVKFVSGITNNVGKILPAVTRMITTFLNGVTSHIPAVVRSAATMILKFLAKVTEYIPRFVAAGARFIIAIIDGLADAIPKLVRAGLNLARRFLNGIADGLAGLGDIGFKAVIRFLNGIEKAIRNNFDDLVAAGIGIADALIDGITQQFGFMAGPLRKAVEKVFDLLPGWAKKILGIHSPSAVFAEIGKNVMLGFIKGVEDSESEMKTTMDAAADNIVKTSANALSKVPNLLEGMMDLDPVITPVLDLSQVTKDAKGLADLTNVTPITAAASYSQAAVISDAQKTQESDQAAQAGVSLSFEQNNYSPESLSDIEIYRQTRNQLSQVKGALGLVTA